MNSVYAEQAKAMLVRAIDELKADKLIAIANSITMTLAFAIAISSSCYPTRPRREVHRARIPSCT